MPSKDPARRFQDIVDNIDRVRGYASGLTRDQFLGSPLVLDAVERCLQRISEAASKLGDLAPELAPDQPWRDIRTLGNVLRHDYDDVSPLRLREMVQDDLDPLRSACVLALKRLQEIRPS